MQTKLNRGFVARHALSRASGIVLSSILVVTPSAMAQEVSTGDELRITPVTVTAQKREQSVQDVPISVTAVTADKIADQGMENLEDLSSFVPGVLIGKSAISTPINIRGVGSGSNRGFEQSVGLYVDGIYLGRDRQFRAPFLDLERVEVLRGPQSILFGKNTIAGAINIQSADPVLGEGPSGNASVRWESETGTTTLNGAATIPLGDKAGLRLAGMFRDGDGYVTNRTRSQDEPGISEYALRSTLLWDVAEDWTLNLKLAYADSEVLGSNSTIVKFSPVTGTVTPPTAINNIVFGNVPALTPGFVTRGDYDAFRDDPRSQMNWSDRDEQTFTESSLAVLNVSHDLSNGAELTFIAGYSDYETKDGIELDFLPIKFIFRDEQQEFSQFSQEIRYVEADEQGFDVILGAYHESQDLKQAGNLYFDTSLGFLPGSIFAGGPTAAIYPLAPVGTFGRNSLFKQDAETTAVFGELTWNVNDDFRVSVGGRYSEDTKDFSKLVWFGGDFTPEGVTGQPASILQENLLLLYVQAIDPANNLVNAKASHAEDGFDPSLKVQWDVTDDVMAFATITKGRKTGGFNGNDDQRLSNAARPFTDLTPAGLSSRNPAYDPTSPGVGFTYDAETATSYEAGFKSQLLNGRAILNASAFLTKYKDLQVNIFQGTGFIVDNAEGAEIKGLELDGQLLVSEGLSLAGSLGYLDFTFSDYSGAGCTVQQISEVVAPCTQDLTGRRNAFAPEWSGNIAVNYERPIANGYEIRLSADANYRGEHQLDYDLDPYTAQKATTKVNARVAFGPEARNWEVAAFGTNLTDEVTYSAIADVPLAPGAFFGFVQEPRVVGLEARVRY